MLRGPLRFFQAARRTYPLLTLLHDSACRVRLYSHSAPSEAAGDLGMTRMMNAAITPAIAKL